jgi:signal recognition particle subunit SRP54
MFEKLRDDLRSALNKIVRASDINEELVDSLCRDIQRALLMSDVKVTIVKSVTDTLKERALKEQPPKGLSRKDHIVTILYGELAKMLGYSGEIIKTIDKGHEDDHSEATSFFKPGMQNIVLLLGIQGSGKTTVAAKLARWLTKHGFRVGVIGADTWRPGALTQLKTNCNRVNVEVYGEEENKDAVAIARNGLDHFKDQNLDVIIIDTAGRHKEETGLLEEMNQMHKTVTPELVLLVIDATIGQQAFSQAKAFHEAAPVGGIILTKLDGTAKGGGALAASAATGAKVMFIGTGERIDDLEQFSPTRFVGRLLDMGDIKALLELARTLEDQVDEDAVKRVMSGKMTIEDFYGQMDSVNKMGGIKSVLENMPGLSGMVKEDQVEAMQVRMERWRFIIQSMTKDEKKNPDIINESRRKRMARGCGLPESEIKAMIKHYNDSKDFVKHNKGRGGFFRRFGIG